MHNKAIRNNMAVAVLAAIASIGVEMTRNVINASANERKAIKAALANDNKLTDKAINLLRYVAFYGKSLSVTVDNAAAIADKYAQEKRAMTPFVIQTLDYPDYSDNRRYYGD